MPSATGSQRRRSTPHSLRSPRRSAQSAPSKYRGWLLGLAGVRLVLGIAAIPLAPFLYKKHFLVLVLMRPTKEVLLAAGFLARRHQVDLVEILIAAVPLAILGVWHAFALGRAYREEIRTGDMPGLGGKLIPVNKIQAMQKVLKQQSAKIVILGRLAVFPSAILAMAAGSSKMKTRRFLLYDLIGGLASIAEVVGAGYLLGQSYKSGKPWLTIAGVVALAAMGIVLGRAMKKQQK